MTTLAFVTPAYRRYDMTEVCLEQHKDVAERLAERGIDAFSVVIADDENLNIAHGLGMATLKRPNVLGEKWNDGIVYACVEGGADFICPLGSDLWVHPDVFKIVPDLRDDLVATSQWMSFVSEDGLRYKELEMRVNSGPGPRIYSRQRMAKTNYRPAGENLMKGLDTSIQNNVQRAAPFKWRCTNEDWLGHLRFINWKSNEVQINHYNNRSFDPVTVREMDTPWEEIRDLYPRPLVVKMEGLYAVRRMEAS